MKYDARNNRQSAYITGAVTPDGRAGKAQAQDGRTESGGFWGLIITHHKRKSTNDVVDTFSPILCITTRKR